MKWYCFITIFILSFQSINSDVLHDEQLREFLRRFEPLRLQGSFPFNVNEKQIAIQGSVDDLTINGLSEMSIDKWEINSKTLTIDFDVSIAKLTSTGRYNAKGLLIHLFPLQGSGTFTAAVKDIHFVGSLKINQDSKNDALVETLHINVLLGTLEINLESLKNSDDIINEILSVVIVDLFYHHKKEIETFASESIKNTLNQYSSTLSKFKAFAIKKSPAKGHVATSFDGRITRNINDVVDKIFSSIRINATKGGWDPITLRPESDTFSVTLFNITVDGEVSISNLRIGGFSAIHRTGDCSLTTGLSGNNVQVYVGGNDIVIGVDFMWGVGIFKANLQIELLVKHVDLMLQVGFVKREQKIALNLEEFLLNEIGNVKITIGGIPAGGSEKISRLLSMVSNLVKDSLIYAFQEALKPGVEKALDSSYVSELLAESFLE